jgi:hypothetical protein
VDLVAGILLRPQAGSEAHAARLSGTGDAEGRAKSGDVGTGGLAAAGGHGDGCSEGG